MAYPNFHSLTHIYWQLYPDPSHPTFIPPSHTSWQPYLKAYHPTFLDLTNLCWNLKSYHPICFSPTQTLTTPLQAISSHIFLTSSTYRHNFILGHQHSTFHSPINPWRQPRPNASPEFRLRGSFQPPSKPCGPSFHLTTSSMNPLYWPQPG